MEKSKPYRMTSTWLRVTSVAWLLTTSTRVTANMVNTGMSPAGDYLLSVTLVMLSFYVAATVLACDAKPYTEAMIICLVFVALAQGIPDPMGTSTARVLIYTLVATVMVLLFVHGGLEIRTSPMWGSVQLLAPITALSWGLASEFGPAGMRTVVGETMPALLITSMLASALFAMIFETRAPARQPVEG